MDALLMIPGPIEISARVQKAFGGPPPSHVAPHVIEAFGRSLEMMRQVWCAAGDSQPFVVGGSGTMAMEMAATNVVSPGDQVVVVNSGYFSDRMGEMLERRGAVVAHVRAPLGDVPGLARVGETLAKTKAKALFATHVDTSTGVRVDAKALAALASEHGALSVFDGVCATAAERFEMAAWGADIYLTASQKAIGLPAGLGLLVVSPRALEARATLSIPPPLSLDFDAWRPIMEAYEARRPSYFSTPPTNLVLALATSLEEILATRVGGLQGMAARFRVHQRVADGLRQAWRSMRLELLCEPGRAANTLSALRYPPGVGPELVAAIRERGVIVAGGLHPECKRDYFRVGHMGDVVLRKRALVATVRAVAEALDAAHHPTDVASVCGSFEQNIHPLG